MSPTRDTSCDTSRNTSIAPRVTWLLPVRNAMPYLTRTLASIEAQTEKRSVVIAWDNGSTDGSIEVLRQWIGPRIPGILVADKPMGLGASLARMVTMTRTPYCARIDGDDLNMPDRIEKQMRYLDTHPDVAVVGSAVKLIGPMDESLGDGAIPACHDADVRWRLRFCNAMSHPTVMFRRGAILAAGNYADIMPIEDYDLWIRVALRFPMANLPDQLVKYRVSGMSVSSKHRHHINDIRRRTIESYGPSLFGDASPRFISRLLRIVSHPDDCHVTLSDLRQLRNAATNAAIQIGQSPDYFRQTALYKVHRNAMAGLWARSLPGASVVLPWIKAAAQHAPGRDQREQTSADHFSKAA